MCTCKHFLQGAFQTGNCWVIRDERCHTELTLHVPFREVMPMPLPPLTNQRTSLIMCAQLLQSCPTLCDPMHGSPPRSSVHGILQARILEWAVIPSSRTSSQSRDRNLCLIMFPALAGRFFITSAPWKDTGQSRAQVIGVFVFLRLRTITPSNAASLKIHCTKALVLP